MIKSDEKVTAAAHAFDGGTVDEDDVEAAVVIAIEEANATAGGVDDVVGFGSGDMDGGEADVLGDVLEGGNGRQAAAVFLGGRGELGERNAGAAGLLARGLRARGGGKR